MKNNENKDGKINDKNNVGTGDASRADGASTGNNNIDENNGDDGNNKDNKNTGNNNIEEKNRKMGAGNN